ncbi:hypothetical protein HPB50_020642 [Hyalomma asiaticum]|uniref:Uncharacterized protein n=1 Tax=Hyalomma asiaticum TaxID=266040 RepID=A0ACB7SCL7_HYAAI|nr:hypothetical protein HPB50_020642 [Hyalomma asiaticum]
MLRGTSPRRDAPHWFEPCATLHGGVLQQDHGKRPIALLGKWPGDLYTKAVTQHCAARTSVLTRLSVRRMATRRSVSGSPTGIAVPKSLRGTFPTGESSPGETASDLYCPRRHRSRPTSSRSGRRTAACSSPRGIRFRVAFSVLSSFLYCHADWMRDNSV